MEPRDLGHAVVLFLNQRRIDARRNWTRAWLICIGIGRNGRAGHSEALRILVCLNSSSLACKYPDSDWYDRNSMNDRLFVACDALSEYNLCREVTIMATITLSDILDDLRVAEEGLHKFERRYWISSDDFFGLYSRGLLDDGENLAEFSEWAGHHKLRQKRLGALEQISKQRLAALKQTATEQVHLTPAEPVLKVA